MAIEFFEEGIQEYANSSDIMKDLNFTFIVRNMANDKYGDAPYISEVLLRPLRTETAVQKRQKLIMAACKRESLVEELRRIIVETSEELDRHIRAIQDSRGKHLTNETNIGIYTEAYTKLVLGLGELDALLEREKNAFLQTPLCEFYEDFYREETKEELEEQKYLVSHLDGFKDKGEMLLQVSVGEGFQLRDMQIIDVKEKARHLATGFFATRKKPAIVDEEVFDDSVEMINKTILVLLDGCFPFLKRWQEFLHTMKRQIMFLYACAGFYNRCLEKGMYFCVPGTKEQPAEQLYELSLALQTLVLPVTNTAALSEYSSIVVTGANQGGKSTFLRSLGIAQVMCQAGMYVPAKTYPLHIYDDIFPHFTRREDASMNMGKFEEELHRMEDILKKSKRGSLFLLNESFATTTEVTAYQIAMDLLHAGMETGRTIWMVTHITTFARALYEEHNKEVLFLSAGRQANEGEIRYRMVQKAPEDTSYGLELFEELIVKKADT
jgi:hypothetical protein